MGLSHDSILSPGGELTDGTPFEGIDWVRILLPGDGNLDGVVDLDDPILAAQGWGRPAGEGRGDFNSDGVVDAADLELLARNWTGPDGASTPIPEPAMLSLLALGGLALVRRASGKAWTGRRPPSARVPPVG